MRILYIAGPYRAPTKEEIQSNINKASQVAKEIWKMGFVALCPHNNTAHFDGVCDEERFLKGGLELLRRCDGIVILPGWQKSAGTILEFEKALGWNIPAFMWPRDKPTIKSYYEFKDQNGGDPFATSKKATRLKIELPEQFFSIV